MRTRRLAPPLTLGRPTTVIVVATDLSGTNRQHPPFRRLSRSACCSSTARRSGVPPVPRVQQRDSLLGEASVAVRRVRARPARLPHVSAAPWSHDGFPRDLESIPSSPMVRHVCFELARPSGRRRGPTRLSPELARTRHVHATAPRPRWLDLFWRRRGDPSRSSRLTGHCQAASSAVRDRASCMAFRIGHIPAPRSCTVTRGLLSGLTREARIMLKSSIGMGGQTRNRPHDMLTSAVRVKRPPPPFDVTATQKTGRDGDPGWASTPNAVAARVSVCES